MTSIPDARLDFSLLERRVLEFLQVPSAPEIPEGSAGSLRVFRAGENYYAWLVFVWATGSVFAGLGLLTFSVAGSRGVERFPPWAHVAWAAFLVVAWSLYFSALTLTFLARRLNFRLRWYIVTDRSLRIRSGVFAVTELTMTYRNVQEIRVTAGPLQHALGLATVEVHAAGGGGDPKHGGGGHVGRLEGLSNATEIRDVMVERLRQYRDSGLGDVVPAGAALQVSELAAARVMLDEARALRACLESAPR